jgi:Family of unknown function (DUF5723)
MTSNSCKFYMPCLPGNSISGILFLLFIFFVQIPDASAQNNTLYLIQSIPQANQLNPALNYPCRMYISLPVISSVRGSIRNTGFGFHDVFYADPVTGSDNYYLDLNKLNNKLRRMNFALVNTDVDLLGLGFPFKDWYITIGISSHTSSQVSYPHDIALLNDGNLNATSGIVKPVKLNDLEFNSTAWNSISISASKELKEGFRVGARLKYLNGMANVSTRRSGINLQSTTNPVSLLAQVNYRVYSSFPLAPGFASDGSLNNVSFEPARHNIVSNYIFNGNRGFAFDGGLTYNPDDATQISASFTDIGFIYWKKNLNNFSVNKTYLFTATDLDNLINSPSQDNLISAIRDSLRNSVHASTSPNSYITALPFNLYGGITRELLPNLKAGAMTWIEINSGQVRPSITLSLNFTPFKAIATSVSYTLMNNKFNQIGGGLVLGNRNAQFYIITDNITIKYTSDIKRSLIWPYNARMLSLRFGVNIFFCGDKKEKGKGMGTMKKLHAPKTKTKDDCPAYW